MEIYKMKTIPQYTKAQLIQALKDNKLIEVYQPGPFPQTKEGIIQINQTECKVTVRIKNGFIKELK